MSEAAAELLKQTCADEPKWEPAMEFIYKSGQRPLEGYTIKRGLGWGGFGEVYFAVSDGGKEVALKLIQRHLDVELRGVAHCLNLKHPHLLAVYDVRETEKGENWVVMEYMAGNSLRARIDQAKGGLPIDETLSWLSGICGAIEHLHQHGIVHRDLKPGNVFRENDLVKVGDYGLSKFISTSRRSGQTQSVGTVHYMAPEISTGNYDQGVDLYAVAVMTYEMMTGDVPFDGETAGEILMKHLTAAPDINKVDVRYRPIFAKSLEKDPSRRYRTAKDFYDAIRRAARGEAQEVAVAEPAPRPARPAAAPAVPAIDPLQLSIPPAPGTFAAKRRGLSERFWEMFVAGTLSPILTVLAVSAGQILDNRPPDMKTFASLATLTGLSSWGLMALARYWDKHEVEKAMRRLCALLFGLVIGAAALGVNFALDFQLPSAIDSPVGRIVYDETFLRQVSPTLLVYCSLFGITLAIPDWARTLCKVRDSRFSFWGGVAWPTAVAFIVASIFEGSRNHGPDPLWVASIVAMIGIVTQWVSPFEPKRKRLRYAVRG